MSVFYIHAGKASIVYWLDIERQDPSGHLKNTTLQALIQHSLHAQISEQNCGFEALQSLQAALHWPRHMDLSASLAQRLRWHTRGWKADTGPVADCALRRSLPAKQHVLHVRSQFAATQKKTLRAWYRQCMKALSGQCFKNGRRRFEITNKRCDFGLCSRPWEHPRCNL